jgi:hypothetical protein
MKKIFILGVVIGGSVILFSNCHSGKKSMKETSTTITTATAVSYSSGLKSIVAANCSPCHIPEKGGNKKALDNYDALKTNINDVIRRIELNPTDMGFMPFKHSKLSDSTIAVFKQWRDAGMPE